MGYHLRHFWFFVCDILITVLAIVPIPNAQKILCFYPNWALLLNCFPMQKYRFDENFVSCANSWVQFLTICLLFGQLYRGQEGNRPCPARMVFTFIKYVSLKMFLAGRISYYFTQILDETHQRYVKARENKEGQTFASGCIVDCETARSNSCESLVKNSQLSFTCNKQVSFASDCTLMKTGPKLYDLPPWRNSKGSLPNLSSSTLNVKFSISNGMLNDDTYVKRICLWLYFRKVGQTSWIIDTNSEIMDYCHAIKWNLINLNSRCGFDRPSHDPCILLYIFTWNHNSSIDKLILVLITSFAIIYYIFRLDIDYSAKFIQHILHNCAIALKRICADEDSRGQFHEHGGMDVVNKILSSQYSNEAVIPYLVKFKNTIRICDKPRWNRNAFVERTSGCEGSQSVRDRKWKYGF